MAGKVIHFEIPIDDSQRAIAFYSAAFGWNLEKWGPVDYWSTSGGDGPGIDGGLTMRSEDSPAPAFYIEVDDVDAALDAVEAAGGRRLTDKLPIPTVGWMAKFADSEGNRVGVFQDDPSAPMPDGPMP